MKNIIISMLLIVSTYGFAQQDSAIYKLSAFVKNINAFNHLYPQEKVYLHFDNTGYFLGETIWFKAYVVTATDLKSTSMSRILYVELLSPEGHVVETKKLKIENGQCHGEFALTHNMVSGFYEVRAYSRYMLNFGDDCIFSRVFPVGTEENINELDKIKAKKPDNRSPFYPQYRKPKKKSKQKINIAFFPEGGNLVSGLTSKVAFKLSDENGRSIEAEGALLDEKKKEISRFQTLHQGMGFFEYTPNEKPQTIVISKDGKKYKFDMPAHLPVGYVMSVTSQNEKEIKVLLKKSEALDTDSLGVAVSCRGKVYSFETVFVQNEEYVLNTKDLPEGVNRITLFNSLGLILSDRLFYVNKKDNKGRIIPSFNKKSYVPFEKVQLDFSVLNEDGQPLSSCFSLSVRDAGKDIATAYTDNIQTNLLLCSELKGYIENPAYYFEEESPQQKAALDLLMLTQGWRRYSWEISTGLLPFNPGHPVEKEIQIKGKILSMKDKRPLNNILVTTALYENDTTTYRSGTHLTRQDGDFIFSVGDFTGPRSLELFTDSADKPIETRITLDRQFSPDAKTYSCHETISPKEVLNLAYWGKNDSVRSTDRMQYIEEVMVSQKRIRPDIVYDVEKEVNYYLDQGLDLPYRNFIGYLRYRDKNYGESSIDGRVSYNGKRAKTYLRSSSVISVKGIQKIIISFEGELYREKEREWDNSDQRRGYVVIFLYHYDFPIRDYIGFRYTMLNGYSVTKEFYAPNYTQTPPISGEIDFRRTLFWNPNVKTDSLGKANVSFYNNSSCKQMSISAEGITSDGIIVYFALTEL